MSKEQEKKINISCCAICLDTLEDAQGDPGVQIVVCKVCHCTVHHRCWGQDKKFELLREANPKKNQEPQTMKRFTCDRCKYNSGSEKCVVCKKNYNQVYLQRIRVAQSEQSHRKITYQWAHTLCALSHDAFEVSDFREMEITMNPEKILIPSDTLECSLCQEEGGLVYPNKHGNQFAHLVCIKLQMLEEIEPNRDGKVVGWSVEYLNKPGRIQAEKEELKEQTQSSLKMQTRTRSRKEHAIHLHQHVSWVRDNITSQRGGSIQVLAQDERKPETICICGNQDILPNDDRFWVACDTCAIWYHGECINKKQDEFDQESIFVCKRCLNWNKQKQDLISEVKPHYQVSKASLMLDLNATGNFLTALLPNKILQESEHLLMSEIGNTEKMSHSGLKLVDQILVAWVWQKRAVNLTRYCANLGLLLEHLRMALFLPLKINSTIYMALVQKVNLGISAAKQIEEVVLATPSEAGKCLPAQACDAIEKINNKLYNEIKLTLPTDFQPSLLTQASSVLLTLDRLRKPTKNISPQRQGYCLASEEELSRTLKITKALTAFSIPEFSTRKTPLFATIDSFFFEPVALLFECPAVASLTQDFHYMQQKLETRALFGPSSPEHQKVRLAMKEYKTWLDNYQHTVSLIQNPSSVKKKRASLVPLKASSVHKKQQRQGLGVVLNQLEQDEEWLFYYNQESKSKLSMGDVQQLIDEANQNIPVDLSRETQRLKDLGNKFQELSQVAGQPHSEAISRLESKIKKRPKTYEQFNSIREIAEHILLDSSLVPLEIDQGFVKLYDTFLTWKRNTAKLFFQNNQNTQEPISLIQALQILNSEYLSDIPLLLPESDLTKLKEQYSSFDKWKNRYEYVLNECSNGEAISDYLSELNTLSKQSGISMTTQEGVLLERKMKMQKDPKGFIISQNMSFQKLIGEIEMFGLKEYFNEAGLIEEIQKAREVEQRVLTIIEEAKQGMEPQEEELQQILQIELPLQIDMKPVRRILAELEWKQKAKNMLNGGDVNSLEEQEIESLIQGLRSKIGAKEIPFTQSTRTLLDELKAQQKVKVAEAMVSKLTSSTYSIGLKEAFTILNFEQATVGDIAESVKSIKEEVQKWKQLLDMITEWRIQGKYTKIPNLGNQGILNSFSGTMEFQQKYPAVSFEDYQSELRSLEYWEQIYNLLSTLESGNLVDPDMLKQVMQNAQELQFFNTSLEFLVSQSERQQYLKGIKELKEIMKTHIEWEKQQIAFQAYKMRLQQSLPFLKDAFNIQYLNSLIDSKNLKTNVVPQIENLQKLKENYLTLRDEGEAILLGVEKGDSNYEEKLGDVVERYHRLGIADDQEHYSPYVYKNSLLLINLKMILEVSEIADKGVAAVLDVDDLERVLFQIKCTFGLHKSASLKAIRKNQKWSLYIIPKELEEGKQKIEQFDELVTEIREHTHTLGDLFSKLARFSGDKETQPLGAFERVMNMVERVSELARFIEFDSTQLEEIKRQVQKVRKVQREFMELRDSSELVPIKSYLDLYHQLRRLPFSLDQTAAEMKNLFVKTKTIKKEIESTLEYYEENKMQSGLALLSKARVQNILDKYQENKVSFTEGETLSRYLKESEELFNRLNSEFMPRLEAIETAYDSLGSTQYQKRARKIKEAQGILADVDTSLRAKMKVDFGPHFAKIQFRLFSKKYKYYVATIEELLAEGDITLGSEMTRQKIKPTVSILEQLENEALGLQRSVLGSTKSELGTIQFHLSEARLLGEKLRRTFNRTDFNTLRGEIERGCVSLQEEMLEQGIKVNMHDPEPRGGMKMSSNLQKRNSGQIKEGFGLSEIISAMENKPAKSEGKEIERKREIGKKGPYVYTSDRDNVKARVDARKHFEEILTGAKENNPKPSATPIYMSNITRTQELAASLEKEAYNIRSKIDAGYDTLINRYSGPLVKLQHYPLMAQELIHGSNRLNILKICKQTVDLIFEEKLDNIETKLQKRQSQTNLPRRKPKEEESANQPIETILEKTSQFQEKLKKVEDEAQKKEAEEVTERLQSLYSEIRQVPMREEDDADSLPSQPEAGQFSPNQELPKLVAKESSTYEQIFQNPSFKEEKHYQRSKEEEKSKQLYDPFSVLSALPEEAPLEKEGEPEQKGVYMLWEGMLMIGNTSTPIATCIYALDSNKKLKQLAKFESAGTLRIKGRCKVEDILDYYRKNQHSRVQVRGWLHCELASAKQEEQYMNYYKELELTRKVGAVKLDSTNIYIFPWNNCTPELQRAWFNFEGESASTQPRFGVLISHKQSMVGRPLDPISVKDLSEQEYTMQEELAAMGGEEPQVIEVVKEVKGDPDEEDSLQSMPEQPVPQQEVESTTTLEQLKSVIIERLNQTGPDAEAQAEEVKQLFIRFCENLPQEQIEELLEAIPERERALLTGTVQMANLSPQLVPAEEIKSPEHVAEEKGSELAVHIDREKRSIMGEVAQEILDDYETVFMFMNQHCGDVKAKIIEVEKQRYNV